MNDFIIIIPVRLDSTRLPGKPLLRIGDKPLLQHVYEHACQSDAARVVIATDSVEIAQLAKGLDAEVLMTAAVHRSGTDRIAEACTLLGLRENQVIVNVQGDEFMLPASLTGQVAADLQAHPEAAMTTLCEAITVAEERACPDIVKVVFDQAGMALYFSRAAIPYMRGDGTAWRHIGVYGYRVGFVQRFCRLAASELEVQEGLEQLRAMSYGYRIHVSPASAGAAIGIDTEADLARARKLYDGMMQAGRPIRHQQMVAEDGPGAVIGCDR